MGTRIIILILLAGLGACDTHYYPDPTGPAYDPHANLNPDYGNSVRSNTAAQVANPVPVIRAGVTVTNGERVDSAVDRYLTNKIYQPIRPYQSTLQEGAPTASPTVAPTGSGPTTN